MKRLLIIAAVAFYCVMSWGSGGSRVPLYDDGTLEACPVLTVSADSLESCVLTLSAGSGDNVAVNGSAVTDPDFQDSSNVEWTVCAGAADPHADCPAAGDLVATVVGGAATSGTCDTLSTALTHELGGLEADVSAYAGLVSITGGATAAVTTAAGINALIAETLCESDGTNCEMDSDSTTTLTNKTLDGDGTGNTIQMKAHATDCTANVTGKADELCVDRDDGKIWVCVPSAGDCDSAPEWKRTDLADGSGGVDPDDLDGDATDDDLIDSAIVHGSFGAAFKDPASSDTLLSEYFVTAATVERVYCMCDEATSADMTFAFCTTANNDSCTTIETVTCDVDGATVTGASLDDPDVDAGTVGRITVGTVDNTGGPVDNCFGKVYYTGGK